MNSYIPNITLKLGDLYGKSYLYPIIKKWSNILVVLS